MKWITSITYLVLILSSCITVAFVNALMPTSAGAYLFFVAWLVIPYVVLGATLISVRREKSSSICWQLVALLVAIGGIIFLADTIFWHPDPQGAIAVLMTPIFQGGAAALLLPVAAWTSRCVS